MNDDLILCCDACGSTSPPRPYAPWPHHCDQPMRLANTTDRNGCPIETTKSLHPAGGSVPA